MSVVSILSALRNKDVVGRNEIKSSLDIKVTSQFRMLAGIVSLAFFNSHTTSTGL